ncbi:MAG: hypothetical protein A2521_04290 [Deltaproteobacteria bacterium RIFOXYD12_FULL_57_12]|nr:MAG: hypothetical protein A2521_04290 [Deltaproteobacteria bacterium RIFOXYD12_FULL_57_12]
MALIINTNIGALNAQRNLGNSQNVLAKSMARLSSGLRINSAKDDAAGLAIANRMTSQIRGINQAARNASDAISMAQTAESSMQEMTNNLHRMRELAVQSRNATNTSSDRESLDAEFQQLLSEIDRLAANTAFNGRKVLDGTLGTSVFQVGANVGETISVDVSSSMRTNVIGKGTATATYTMASVTDNNADATMMTADDLVMDAGELIINGENIGATEAGDEDGQTVGSAFAIAAAINLTTEDHGVTATAQATTKTFDAVGDFAFTGTTAALAYTVSINGTEVIASADQGLADPTLTMDELVEAINAVQGDTGVVATIDDDGALLLTAADGRNIELTEKLVGAGTATEQVVSYFGTTLIGIDGTTATANNVNTYKGSVVLTSADDFTVSWDDGDDVDIFAELADGAEVETLAPTLADANILDETGADDAINSIDQAITDVDTLRGTFGAIQSRFESTIASLQATAENVTAARSRIMDADIAAETAEMTKANILQQAGVAILAQANQTPQLALSLLR